MKRLLFLLVFWLAFASISCDDDDGKADSGTAYFEVTPEASVKLPVWVHNCNNDLQQNAKQIRKATCVGTQHPS